MKNTTLARTLGLALALSGLAGSLIVTACGGNSAPTTPPPPTTPPVGSVPPPTPPPTAPGALALGAPPITLQVPALPGYTLTVAQPGELQIDAIGAPMDAQLWLTQNGSIVTQDSDSGDGVNARIVAFVNPGTYEIHVGEWQLRPMTAQVQVQRLLPMTAVASIAPGAPPAVVNAPQGDSARNASVELTLTVAAPGNYRIDVTDPSGQFDPELMLIQNGALIQQDSDSGGNRAAQITRQLAPGTYTLRVRDWINRAAAISVSVTPV